MSAQVSLCSRFWASLVQIESLAFSPALFYRADDVEFALKGKGIDTVVLNKDQGGLSKHRMPVLKDLVLATEVICGKTQYEPCATPF